MKLFARFRQVGLLACMALLLNACSDDDPAVSPDGPNSLANYEVAMRATQQELNIALNGMDKSIERIESKITWLEITPGEMQGTTPTVDIRRIADTPENFDHDFVYVYFGKTDCITLVVTKEGELMPVGDNDDEYKAFNTRWWEQGDILYHSGSRIGGDEVTERILLPWNDLTTSNIPSDAAQDSISRDYGWEMAFNLFACEESGRAYSRPYFGLYNKYTGVLRVFYYQREEPGNAGEYSIIFNPSSAGSQKYPYYHSLQYGIPMGNGEVQGPLVMDLGGSLASQNTFDQIIAPYRKSDGMLKKGWYCFDMDLSAYRPGLSTPFGRGDRLSFEGKTSSSSSITLLGSLDGGIDGNFKAESTYSTTTSNGLNYLDQFNSGISNITECVKGILSKDYLTASFRGGLSIYNFSNALLGKAQDNYMTKGETNGVINMNLGATMSLKGYAFTHTSNNTEGAEFSYNAFNQSEHFGQGVWSLQENPVVYVLGDRLIGDDESFTCFVESGDYSYPANDPAYNNLRLMTFLDPTSIKLNFNTALFKNIRNANVSWVYGVYPNQPKGHTEAYRRTLLKMKPAAPKIVDHSTYNGEIYSDWCDFGMTYVAYDMEDMKPVRLSSTTKARIYAQKGANYRYYGHAGNNEPESSATFFVEDPIVMLPTTFEDGTGRIGDFEAPDFFVGVMIDFEYTQPSGKPARAVFSKRFIPEVREISAGNLQQKRDELDRYVQGGVHQTINGVQFKAPAAEALMEQFFDTSRYILEYEY